MKVMKKKGVSEVMGYILLISFAIFMSFIVYQGLRTYVPTSAIECPDGVSIFVKSVSCTLDASDGKYDLEVLVKNNGRYNIAGYFIYAGDKFNQTVATIPLIDYLAEACTPGGGSLCKFNNAVLFESSTTGNFVNISEDKFAEYNNIPTKIYSLDIIPLRFQKEENRLRIVSCGKAMTREKIDCA